MVSTPAIEMCSDHCCVVAIPGMVSVVESIPLAILRPTLSTKYRRRSIFGGDFNLAIFVHPPNLNDANIALLLLYV